MKTARPHFSILASLVVATACAEAGSIGSTGAAGAGGTSSANGGATASSGGATAPLGNGGVTVGQGGGAAKGGSTGSTIVVTFGGMTTGSGGAATTTPVSCGTTSGELTVTNTPRNNELGAVTDVVPAAGASIPVSEIGLKFCFKIMTTSAVTISPSAMKIYSGGIRQLPAEPWNINFDSTTKVTVETATGGGYCMVIDVAGAAGAASATLTGTAKINLDWVVDTTQLGGAMLDPTEPANMIATRAGAVAGCAEVKQ